MSGGKALNSRSFSDISQAASIARKLIDHLTGFADSYKTDGVYCYLLREYDHHLDYRDWWKVETSRLPVILKCARDVAEGSPDGFWPPSPGWQGFGEFLHMLRNQVVAHPSPELKALVEQRGGKVFKKSAVLAYQEGAALYVMEQFPNLCAHLAEVQGKRETWLDKRGFNVLQLAAFEGSADVVRDLLTRRKRRRIMYEERPVAELLADKDRVDEEGFRELLEVLQAEVHDLGCGAVEVARLDGEQGQAGGGGRTVLGWAKLRLSFFRDTVKGTEAREIVRLIESTEKFLQKHKLIPFLVN